MSSFDIPSGLEYRRAEIERVADIGGGMFRCDFFVDLKTPGEFISQLGFGVRFVEKPMMTTGFDVGLGQQLPPGKFPVVTGGVYVWKSGRRPDNGLPFYDGCTLCIVATGSKDLVSTLHVSFAGKALRNPAGLDNVSPS